MANIKSAQKRIKVIAKKTANNKANRSELKTVIKKFNEAVDSGDKALAQEKYVLAEKTLDKNATKGTIHKSAASRKASRLAKRLNKMA
ncbi:MAG: 30S ribosomal protein S20 [Clostridiales bacterium]|nr:30S ribosomal protein S20 [Clostridiales bacterium]